MKNLEDYEIISFDIFDTLITRPYIHPYHLLKHIEKYTNRQGFEYWRLNAESLARQKANSRQDVTLDEIYDNIPETFRDLKQTELNFELNLLKPLKKGTELYQQAITSGKKIAFISDMYLPKEFLIKVLKKNGFDKFDYFYLSCEHGKTKYSGDLFKIFLKDVKIAPNKILHIGDNYNSDVLMPKKLGIQTFHNANISENFFKNNEHFKILYERNQDSLTISVILKILALKENQNTYWQDFAYMIAGPIYWGFSQFILSEIEKHDIKQLVFVARDCYILKKVWDLIYNKQCKTYYVYAQRMINAKCFLTYGDEHNADMILDILSKELDLKIPIFSSFYEKSEFLSKQQSLLKNYTKNNQSEYKKYLSSLGIKDKESTAIIDSGAANFSAQKLLSYFIPKSDIYGIYTMANHLNAYKDKLKISTYSSKPEDMVNITNLIEFIMMSVEPPVIDIKNDKPVYQEKPSFTEIQRGQICNFMQDYIIYFVRDINNAINKFKFVPDIKDLNSFVKCFLSNMSSVDKKQFKNIKCASNATHTEYNDNLYNKVTQNIFDEKIISLFGIKILKITSSDYKTVIKIFRFLPVLHIIKKLHKNYIKFFGLPLLKIKQNDKKYYIYLFYLIKFMRIKINN